MVRSSSFIENSNSMNLPNRVPFTFTKVFPAGTPLHVPAAWLLTIQSSQSIPGFG